MNIGIISEFNPFHSGHKYLIDKVKGENDSIIAVMSGNFVQRGEFAIIEKHQRAESAIKNGADLVIEIPTVYSTLSAEGFAKAGCEILKATGLANAIAFGAETDDVDKLIKLSNIIKNKDTIEKIKIEMKSGLSYPQARNKIIDSSLLNSPNNILAIEYLKHTDLLPIAVKRIGKGHDTDDKEYSASAIRKAMLESDFDYCSIYNCEKAVLSNLRTMSAEDFKKVIDVTDGLENRIVSAVKKATSINECYGLIKTKRYTHSRIRRIILRSYLGIDNSFCENVPYIKILAFNSKGQELLREMKKTASLPVLMRHSDSLSLNCYGKKVYNKECMFTDLFALGYKTPKKCSIEQTTTPIIL